jgi:hypothetical protein
MATVVDQRREVVVMSGAQPVYQDLSNHHRGGNYRAGHQRQMFTVNDPELGVAFRGSYTTALEGPASIRHHHNFEQLRYLLDGEWEYGRRRIKPGTIGFFGESVHYGPLRCLKASRSIGLQYPGWSGAKFISRAEEKQVQKEMVEKGVKFDSGLATWPDGRKQDGSEALWEYWAGEKLDYAKPRFDDEVWLHTERFEWESSDVKGVAIKRLAYLDQRGPAVSLLKLEPGASTPAGHSGAMMLRFVYEGEAEYAGQACPPVSCIYYPPQSDYEPITSAEGCTIYSVELQLGRDAERPLPYRI